jgi:hypothetical protein
MTATAHVPTPKTPAGADPNQKPLTLAAFGGDQYRVLPYAPGIPSNRRGLGDVFPRPCVVLTFLLGMPGNVAKAEAAALALAKARCAAVREQFLASHPAWRNVLAIKGRLDELQRERADALKRAEDGKLRVRKAIIANDRAADDRASAEVKAAEGDAANALSRHQVVAEQLPHARAAAREALAQLLEAERAAIEGEAVATARQMAEEIQQLVGERFTAMAAAHVTAMVANGKPSIAAEAGVSAGLVDHFAELPR